MTIRAVSLVLQAVVAIIILQRRVADGVDERGDDRMSESPRQHVHRAASYAGQNRTSDRRHCGQRRRLRHVCHHDGRQNTAQTTVNRIRQVLGQAAGKLLRYLVRDCVYDRLQQSNPQR